MSLPKIQVMVVDDHKMFVEGVQAIFSDSSHIQVVKTVHDGNEVMKSIENTPNLDIILLDINLPNINGLELTKLISKKYPTIKILILSMYNNAEYIKEVLKEGASGYVLKNTDHEELPMQFNQSLQATNFTANPSHKL